MGPGSGEWFGRLVRTQTAEEKRTDMLMVGDFGNSPDGEKGLIMALANLNPNPNPNHNHNPSPNPNPNQV